MKARLVATALLALTSGCGHARGPARPLRREPSMSPIVALHFAFRAGSVDDPRGREGLTALTADAMLEGGGRGLGPAELRRALFPLAATIEVETDREWTGFVARVHRDHVDRLLELLEAVLVDPALPEETVARLRDRAKSELVLGLLGTDEEALAREALRVVAFGEGHPYAHPVLGVEHALGAMRRQDVLEQRRRVFCRSRLRVGVSGDAPPDVERRVARFVARIPNDGCAEAMVPPPSTERARELVVLDSPDAEAVAIRVAIPHEVTRAHPDYVALYVAAAHLGLHGQFLGTLMQDVREARGLNYGDYVYAEPRAAAAGLRGPAPHHLVTHPLFEAVIRPVGREHAHFVVRLVVRSMERLIENGLTDAELARVRDFLLRTMPLELEVDESRLGFAMDADALGSASTWPVAMREGLARLTAADVHAAAQRHLDAGRLRVVLVASNGAELAERIATDAPSSVSYDHAVSDAVRAEDRVIERYPLRFTRERVRVVRADSMFR